MPNKKIEREARSGHGSDGSAFVSVERRTWNKGSLDYTVEVLANYTIQYFPDSNEIIVSSGDEIVYSELLS